MKLDPYTFGPDQTCFGCGPHNDHGMRLEFRVEGDEVVTEMTPGKGWDGPPNVFHGGLQATVADEMREVRTICRCGKKASMVVRIGEDGHVVREGAQVAIGGNDRYVSLCRRHWEEEMGRSQPDDFIGFLR